MSKITFACSYCGKKLSASETSAGREKTCPNCRARVVVPTPEVAAARGTSGAASKPRQNPDHALLLMGKPHVHHDLIDMTAMVDIVFFLLIFFLVTSLQSLEAVIHLPVPQAKSSKTVQAVPSITNDAGVVMVSIDDRDEIFVDDEPVVSEQELRTKLRTAKQEEDRDSMMITGSPEASHGKFVMVLDAGAAAGMSEIRFSVPETDAIE